MQSFLTWDKVVIFILLRRRMLFNMICIELDNWQVPVDPENEVDLDKSGGVSMKKTWTGAALVAGVFSVCLMPGFASAKETVVTIPAAADTYIEKGDSSPNGSMTSMLISDDGKGNEGWGFVRWDLSKIPKDAQIVGAVFEILQTDYGLGDGLDIYVIDKGAWKESRLTWKSWHAMSTEITRLGVLTPIYRFSTMPCSFADPALAETVRQWHSGDKENNGLILKWHHDTQWGSDHYIPREHPHEEGPLLIIRYTMPSE